jgi:hypothetical protein
MIDPVCIISHNSTEPSYLVEVVFQIVDKKFNLYFKSDENTLLSGNTEAFLACALLPSMKMGGGQIITKGEVSHKFLSALSMIQDIYCTWQPSFKRTEITGITTLKHPPSSPKRVGVFLPVVSIHFIPF